MNEGEAFALGMYHGATGKDLYSTNDPGLSIYFTSNYILMEAYESGHRIGVTFAY